MEDIFPQNISLYHVSVSTIVSINQNVTRLILPGSQNECITIHTSMSRYKGARLKMTAVFESKQLFLEAYKIGGLFQGLKMFWILRC